MSSMVRVVVACLAVAVVTTAAMAQPADKPADAPSQVVMDGTASRNIGRAVAIIGSCLGAAGAAIGGGYGIARIGGRCIDAIARQPEAASSMFAPMIISAAMVEGGMLFAMVVCLLGVLYI